MPEITVGYCYGRLARYGTLLIFMYFRIDNNRNRNDFVTFMTFMKLSSSSRLNVKDVRSERNLKVWSRDYTIVAFGTPATASQYCSVNNNIINSPRVESSLSRLHSSPDRLTCDGLAVHRVNGEEQSGEETSAWRDHRWKIEKKFQNMMQKHTKKHNSLNNKLIHKPIALHMICLCIEFKSEYVSQLSHKAVGCHRFSSTPVCRKQFLPETKDHPPLTPPFHRPLHQSQYEHRADNVQNDVDEVEAGISRLECSFDFVPRSFHKYFILHFLIVDLRLCFTTFQ